MIAAIISVLIGIFPGFMMKFVDRVTPDNVAVAMPQYNPAGAPKFIPSVDTHGAPDGHGAPVDSHGASVDTHETRVDSHGKPVDTHEAADTHEAPEPHGESVETHGVEVVPHEQPADH